MHRHCEQRVQKNCVNHPKCLLFIPKPPACTLINIAASAYALPLDVASKNYINTTNMHVHSFHIPVMGIGYTIDSPIRVAHLGISSAISLVDDMLTERMREFYSKEYKLPFAPIARNDEDSRANRITAYLNTVHHLVQQKARNFKAQLLQQKDTLQQYMDLLPDTAELKKQLQANLHKGQEAIKQVLEQHYRSGSIDVNIMTKLDKANYRDRQALPIEYNDAHASLRGFAQSEVSGALVLSAGMNARLYSYMEQFADFYPGADGTFNKKIILKVSDYRSAIVQGKIFAKKGLWISEFRVESGLNCGGHAFATQGFLLGPILEEFSNNRAALQKELFDLYKKGLEAKDLPAPDQAPEMRLTAQGGVGTAEEHNNLMQSYGLDSVGWGSPFLLVPEAVAIDPDTIELLAKGQEKDYFLSHVSPVGVRFNNIRGASRDLEQQALAKAGKPGAACTKQFILLNTEFTERPICTASSRYQKLKIEELDKQGLSTKAYQKAYQKIVDKSCICNGLGVATLNSHDLDTTREGQGVSICPGPNLAYFNRKASLNEMVDHIYGRSSLLNEEQRPNLFIKELGMYLDYLQEEFDDSKQPDARQIKGWEAFIQNLRNGMAYYQNLFDLDANWSEATREKALGQLDQARTRLNKLEEQWQTFKEKVCI